jgi:hypothetical protein
LIGHRFSSINNFGADFVNPMASTESVWSGGAHVAPTMTKRTSVTTPGNVTSNEPSNAPDIENPTLGSDNTQTNLQVTNYLTQQGQSQVTTYSHKNELLKIELYASMPWYRPMDVIHVEVMSLDPTIQALDGVSILRNYRYIVQSARHTFHTNKVEYIVGRREDYEVEQVPTNLVDGYGDVTTPKDKKRRLFELATDAMSNTTQ